MTPKEKEHELDLPPYEASEGLVKEPTGSIILPEPFASRIRKTPLMVLAEDRFARPGESIGDVLHRLHVDEGKPFAVISQEFRIGGLPVSNQTLISWARKLDPEMPIIDASKRSNSISTRMTELWQDPEHREFRISRMKSGWEDPEIKRARVAKIHTPESDASRSEAIRRYHEEHPKAASTNTQAIFWAKALKGILAYMINVEDYSTAQIAEIVNRSNGTVRTWLREFDIHSKPGRKGKGLSRETIEERRHLIETARERDLLQYLTSQQRRTLIELYPEKGVRVPTLTEVGKKLGVVREEVRQLDIRGLAKLDKLLRSDFPADFRKRESPIKIDKIFGENPRQLLQDLYWKEGLTSKQIAEQFKCSNVTVLSRMRELGIPIRPKGCSGRAKQKRSIDTVS